MSVLNRPRVFVRGVLVVALVGVVGITSAQSRAPSPDETRFAACSARVLELEAEVRSLREQLRVASAATVNPPAPSAVPSRRFNTAHEINTIKQSDSCNPPFRYDPQGIKYYRPECLVPEESPACTVPYTFTSSGSKFYKPNCLDAKPIPGCDPPYVFDARGVKNYKSECFKM